jgi:hypothetical protein
MFEQKTVNVILRFAALSAVAVVCLAPLQTALAVDSPLPREIKDVAMGASMASVAELIAGSGAVSQAGEKTKKRPKLIWTPLEHPHYQTIEFNFTEKDRLFLIRYNLKEGPRKTFQDVKKAFFNLYKFQRDDPMRIKVEGNDALLYDRPENSYIYFFEITDRRTGNKSIELMERSISAQDRAKPQPEATPQSGDNAPQPTLDKKEPDQK